ncbi:hypothetical protein GCM10029964_093290 [Kibdelosporangium lantanae]
MLCLLAATLCATLGTFAVYTYITAVVAPVTRHGVPVTLLLAAYGVGAVAGNLFIGRFAARWRPAWMVLGAAVLSGLGLVALTAVSASPVAMVAVLMAWAGGSWALYGPVNSALLSTTDDSRHGAVLLSFNASAIYLGMAGGGAVGGALLAGVGVGALAPIASSGALLAAGLVVVGVLWPARRRGGGRHRASTSRRSGSHALTGETVAPQA